MNNIVLYKTNNKFKELNERIGDALLHSINSHPCYNKIRNRGYRYCRDRVTCVSFVNNFFVLFSFTFFIFCLLSYFLSCSECPRVFGISVG